MNDSATYVSRKIREARSVIVITGPGVVDFELERPTTEAFKENPSSFYYNLIDYLWKGKPRNKCKNFLPMIEKMGKLRRVATQNIDETEGDAITDKGKVIELCGNIREYFCLECKSECTNAKESISSRKVPRCRSCEGAVAPRIIFHGMPTAPRSCEALMFNMCMADLILVIGVSLERSPFLPSILKSAYGQIIVFPSDSISDFPEKTLFLNHPISEFLSEVMQLTS